jgi:microcystin-dependent protein
MRNIGIVFSLFFCILVGAAHAQAPRTIRYDGRLEQNGSPANGDYNLGFALFDAAVNGNQLWPAGADTHATVPVTVSNGNFVVELGGQGMEALGWQVFAAPRVFVQAWVGVTPLNGRRALGAVPFAVRADNGVPPGTLMAFAGTSLPEGWLWCDGAGYPTAGEYSRLFAAIGDAWGRPDGATFNVPDLRGRFLRAVNDMGTGVAPDDGTRDVDVRAVGSVQRDAFRIHDHAMGAHQHFGRVNGRTDVGGNHDHDLPDANDEIDAQAFGDNNSGRYAANGPAAGGAQIRTHFAGDHQHTFYGEGWTDAGGGGNTTQTGIAETRPRNVAVTYIIKY